MLWLKTSCEETLFLVSVTSHVTIVFASPIPRCKTWQTSWLKGERHWVSNLLQHSLDWTCVGECSYVTRNGEAWFQDFHASVLDVLGALCVFYCVLFVTWKEHTEPKENRSNHCTLFLLWKEVSCTHRSYLARCQRVWSYFQEMQMTGVIGVIAFELSQEQKEYSLDVLEREQGGFDITRRLGATYSICISAFVLSWEELYCHASGHVSWWGERIQTWNALKEKYDTAASTKEENDFATALPSESYPIIGATSVQRCDYDRTKRKFCFFAEEQGITEEVKENIQQLMEEERRERLQEIDWQLSVLWDQGSQGVRVSEEKEECQLQSQCHQCASFRGRMRMTGSTWLQPRNFNQLNGWLTLEHHS